MCVRVLCVHVSFILTITVTIALNEGLVLCVTINKHDFSERLYIYTCTKSDRKKHTNHIMPVIFN